MIHETEQDYKRDSQNLAENEEQRNLRLQRLRESRSLEKVNPYEHKRELNSKDMTDNRSLVTTLLFNKMLLCTERTRGYNIYDIKIIATAIFPTGGEKQNSLYTNNNE